MANKRKLNDVEQFYITQNPTKLSIKELAQKFSTSIKTIEKLVNQVKPVETELKTNTETIPIKSEEIPQISANTLVDKSKTDQYWNSVGRRKDGKHAGNVLVMTQAAGQIIDGARETGKIRSEKMKKAIHKPKG